MRPLHTLPPSLVALSGLVLCVISACHSGSSISTTTNVPPPLASPIPTPPAIAAKVTPSPLPHVDPYQQAMLKADGARNLSQSAASPDDWQLVASRWQQATVLMKSVPASSPNYQYVKTRLAEYQRQLRSAQNQAHPKQSTADRAPIAADAPNAPISGGVGIVSSVHLCSYLERVIDEVKRRYAQDPRESTMRELNQLVSEYYRECNNR